MPSQGHDVPVRLVRSISRTRTRPSSLSTDHPVYRSREWQDGDGASRQASASRLESVTETSPTAQTTLAMVISPRTGEAG
jgi:hypothetical protein